MKATFECSEYTTCKAFFKTVQGMVEILDSQRNKNKAIKYCKENDGVLISLNNQTIVDEVSNSLVDCCKDGRLQTRNNQLWHIGLNCKNKVFTWFNGVKFDRQQYTNSSSLLFQRCEDLFLLPDKKSLYRGPFRKSIKRANILCLRNEGRKISNLTASVNAQTISSISTSTTKAFTDSNTTRTVFGLSFTLALSILIIIILSLILFVVIRRKNQNSNKQRSNFNNTRPQTNYQQTTYMNNTVDNATTEGLENHNYENIDEPIALYDQKTNGFDETQLRSSNKHITEEYVVMRPLKR